MNSPVKLILVVAAIFSMMALPGAVSNNLHLPFGMLITHSDRRI